MSIQPVDQQLRLNALQATDTHSFKEIEEFSRAVCSDLAEQYGGHYREPNVIYGLTTFLSSVRQALQQKRPDF